MHPFNRLPGSRRSPAGLEWTVLKKMPQLFLCGTMALFLLWAFIRYGAFSLDEKTALIAQYSILGVIFFHWMCVLGGSLYCAIIWIMKGPAYAMDPYYLPEQIEKEEQIRV